MIRDNANAEDLRSAAKRVGLRYIERFSRGYSRRRCGRGFSYLDSRGNTIRCRRTRERIKALAIPPAWNAIWISPSPRGHMLVCGEDQAGRKQYIYHPEWTAISIRLKYERMLAFADRLPRIRRRLRRDLRAGPLSRTQVLAAIVRLLDKGRIRVGSMRHHRRTGSRGATTLASGHVEIDGSEIMLDFPGKGGKRRKVALTEKRTAKVILDCEDAGFPSLFCYRDTDGTLQRIGSTAVNEYLQAIAGEPITAKDFRTWHASVAVLASLRGEAANDATTQMQRRKAINQALDEVSEMLGNTRTVCRNSYVHPAVLSTYENGDLHNLTGKADASDTGPRRRNLKVDEQRFLRLLPRLNKFL